MWTDLASTSDSASGVSERCSSVYRSTRFRSYPQDLSSKYRRFTRGRSCFIFELRVIFGGRLPNTNAADNRPGDEEVLHALPERDRLSGIGPRKHHFKMLTERPNHSDSTLQRAAKLKREFEFAASVRDPRNRTAARRLERSVDEFLASLGTIQVDDRVPHAMALVSMSRHPRRSAYHAALIQTSLHAANQGWFRPKLTSRELEAVAGFTIYAEMNPGWKRSLEEWGMSVPLIRKCEPGCLTPGHELSDPFYKAMLDLGAGYIPGDIPWGLRHVLDLRADPNEWRVGLYHLVQQAARIGCMPDADEISRKLALRHLVSSYIEPSGEVNAEPMVLSAGLVNDTCWPALSFDQVVETIGAAILRRPDEIELSGPAPMVA
jgi:hypothetical protein